MKKLFTLLAAIATITWVSAQEVDTVQRLSMDDAVTMAYMQNPAITAANEAISAATHRKKAAWGLGAPKLSVGAEYTQMSENIGEVDFNGAKDGVVGFLQQLPLPLPPAIIQGLQALDLSYTLQKKNFGVVGTTLVVPVMTGGKINAVNRAAKIGIENARNSMDETTSGIFAELTERYWGLALAQNIATVRDSALSALRLHAHNATLLEQEGIIAKGERMFADMAVSEAIAALTQARGNANTINAALGGTLGQSGKYQPTTPLFINRGVQPLSFFLQQTAEGNHSLEKLELMKRLSVEMAKIERANFFPTIGAMGTATLWSYNLTNQLPRWTVGAGIKLRIFDGLTSEQSYAAARADTRRVEALQAKAQIDIKALVEKLYTTLQSALEQYDASGSTIAFAEEYLRMKNQAFAEGMATSSDVVDAQLNVAKSRIAQMAAAYAFDTTLANLLAVAGLSESYALYQNDINNQIISY